MNEAALAVLGFLVLVVLARMSPARHRGRVRWPTPGVLITRGPLNRYPTAPPHPRPWSKPWH